MQCPELWGSLKGTESAAQSSQLQNKCQILKCQHQHVLLFSSEEPLVKYLTTRCPLKAGSSTAPLKFNTSQEVAHVKDFEDCSEWLSVEGQYHCSPRDVRILPSYSQWVHITPESPAHKTKYGCTVIGFQEGSVSYLSIPTTPFLPLLCARPFSEWE